MEVHEEGEGVLSVIVAAGCCDNNGFERCLVSLTVAKQWWRRRNIGSS